jgi:hypothetical protein
MAPEDTTEAIIDLSREHCPDQLDACEKSSDCLPQIGGSKIPKSAVAKAATSGEFSDGTSAELSSGTKALLESSGLQAQADLRSRGCKYSAGSTVADCPSGYTNMGCHCERWASTLDWSHMTCPAGRFRTGGRCYVECEPGYENKGECCSQSMLT